MTTDEIRALLAEAAPHPDGVCTSDGLRIYHGHFDDCPVAGARSRLATVAVNILPLLLDVAKAADDYSPERAHDWRCEYRTAEAGWQPGDSPIIRCECGYDELQAALAALDTAMEDQR